MNEHKTKAWWSGISGVIDWLLGFGFLLTFLGFGLACWVVMAYYVLRLAGEIRQIRLYGF